MKIIIWSKSAKLMKEISNILKGNNESDKIFEVLDLLKANSVKWVVEDYSNEDETINICVKVE